ncbi:MAG: sigma-70 family RNA polymerase sigma factor [Agriterribacter sp.]
MAVDLPSIPFSDDALIRKLQESEPHKRRAEEELFKKYMYFIKDGMNRYSLQEEECFDAYSDTILQSIANLTNGSFENRSSLKTYLYRIFSNKCVDLIRKKTTNKNSIYQTSPVTDLLTVIADPAKSIVQSLMEKNDHDMLKQKLGLLGDNCKKLLTMYAEGYNDKELASLMEYKSADVVKTSRLRCLDKLRQLYTQK